MNRSGHGSLSPRSRNDQRRELDRHLIVDRSGDRVHLSLNGVIEILTPDEAIRLGQAIVSAGRVAATKGGRAGT
ncbi:MULTISPECIES: hypothetical protein [Roseomonadaceae]|uniref:Uncharacterized protein n=1 Tax=Falsiroseomonas oleicola TaxID=2801474 RepID=A0ABS6HG21_9PROT|nr:hypothetical protein [Roseomonas oleicola]MBU8547266.1 hypothetical protein [Roseomonas oleicola]